MSNSLPAITEEFQRSETQRLRQSEHRESTRTDDTSPCMFSHATRLFFLLLEPCVNPPPFFTSNFHHSTFSTMPSHLPSCMSFLPTIRSCTSFLQLLPYNFQPSSSSDLSAYPSCALTPQSYSHLSVRLIEYAVHRSLNPLSVPPSSTFIA